MKILFVTGTRAEYSLLKPLIKLTLKDSFFDPYLAVTGSHLSIEHGYTVKEIEEDNIPIYKKIEILLASDTAVGVSKATALSLLSFSELYEDLKPKSIVLLGDRFELLGAATAALFSRIPIIHIHGGEITNGAYDNAIRHSISKMSNLHFVTNPIYRDRLISMGESSNSVFWVGGLGAEKISKMKFYSKTQIEKKYKLRFSKKNILITFHPVTMQENSIKQFNELIIALKKIVSIDKDLSIFFTAPNADNEGKSILSLINEFLTTIKNTFLIKSFGEKGYLSMLKNVDVMMGNSSSGFLEAPSFNLPVINIGHRQDGRIEAKTIVSVPPKSTNIVNAYNLILGNNLNKKIDNYNNPNYKLNTSSEIINIIKNFHFEPKTDFIG